MHEGKIITAHGPRPSDVTRCLEQVSWLNEASPASVETLASLGQARDFRRGTYLFQQGDDSTELFLILGGRIELTSASPDGGERLHSILRTGNVLGEAELLTESSRMTTALAVEDSHVWRCRQAPFVDFLQANPLLLRRLLADLVRRMQALDDLIQDLTSLALKGRVAKALLALALPPEGGPLPRRTVSIAAQELDLSLETMEITQSDLAKLCGGSRENVARVLSDLQRRQAIKRAGHTYQLLDPLYLRRVARLG